MNFLNEIAAGGQTWAHRVRMMKQVLRIALLTSFFTSFVIFGVNAFKRLNGKELQTILYTGKALVFQPFNKEMGVPSNYLRKISKRNYSSKTFFIYPQELLYLVRPQHQKIFKILKLSFRKSASSFGLVFVIFILYFLIRGYRSKQKKHLSGIGVLSDVKLALKLKSSLRASDITMGKVPLLKNSETKHTLICGTTGTGKTNCLNQLLSQIRKRGDRAVIVDTTGHFVSSFYRDSDVILNPYDKRSSKWHPWCECQNDFHYEQLVNSLIPSMQYFDNFFPEAARAVLYSALRKSAAYGEDDIEEFVSTMLRKTIGELYEELKDTDAAVYVDPKGDKTAVSVRATISNSIRHFRPLKKTSNPFSIRDWILGTGHKDQWLFVSCTTEQRKSINSLMSVWFSVAINAMKARPITKKPEKIWFIIDELQSLQKLEYLEESLAELRKYGGCIVLATQDLSQMDKLYGVHSTKSIINLCGTKVCFRQEDVDIAQRMAKFFGEHEFKEVQEGLSYGAHEMRDGVSLNIVEKTKSTIPATRILELNDLEAFIKLPGGIPATKTKFKYEEIKQISKSFEKIK